MEPVKCHLLLSFVYIYNYFLKFIFDSSSSCENKHDILTNSSF